MNILAIGAHPDDLEIFTFGFLAAASARGDTLCLGVATDGAAGGENPGPALATQRANETSAGLAPLGTPTLLGLPDGRLAAPKPESKLPTSFALPLLILITHAPEDYHPDHRALSSFVTDAVGFICPVLFCDTLMGVSFTPDYYIDISEHFTASKMPSWHITVRSITFVSASKIMSVSGCTMQRTRRSLC